MLMVALMGAELLMVIIDPHPLDSFGTVFFQQSLLAVILMWLFLLVCMSLGALVNNQLNLHRLVLLDTSILLGRCMHVTYIFSTVAPLRPTSCACATRS